MVDNLTKKQLEKILRSDEFEALLRLYSEVIDKWREQNIIANTEFQTLKLLFLREGKIQGLREFFEILEGKEG